MPVILEDDPPGRYILIMSEPQATSVPTAQPEVLSLAEAAAWVGVGHMALRAVLDANRVQLLAGMRGERVVRLVRVQDLRQAFPAVAERPVPESVGSVQTRVDRDLLETISLGRLGTDAPTRPPAPGSLEEPLVPDPAGVDWVRPHPPAPRPASQAGPEPVRYLREQLDHSRAQVAATKGENERLQQELLSSADAIKKWLECASPGPQSTGAAAPSRAIEPAGEPAAVAPMGNSFRVVSAPPVGREVVGEPGSQSQRQLRHRLTLAVGIALLGAGLLGWPSVVGMLGWGEVDDGLQVESSGSGGALSASLNPELGSAGNSLSAGAAQQAASSEPAQAGPQSENPGVASVVGVSGIPPNTSAGSPTDPQQESLVHPPGLAVLSRVLGDSDAEPPGDPCMYFSVTRPGMDGRQLLGPCQGAWSASLGSVVASHRRPQAGEEHATCRHHSFFDRALEGSMERARDQARVASEEGWLPPLLLLRVERSAAELLREEVPVWLESGFEAGLLGEEHTIERMETPDHFLVQSWVRYLDFAGVEIRRIFRLSLALGDGPRGDSLLHLRWEEN